MAARLGHCWRYQRSAQRARRIVFGSDGGNRVAENVAYRRSELASSLVSATRLHLLKDCQDITRRYLSNWPRSERGEGKAHEPFELAQCRRRFPVTTLLLQQFLRNSRERIPVSISFCATFASRLTREGSWTAGHKSSLAPSRAAPGLFQPYVRVDADRERLLNTSEAIGELNVSRRRVSATTIGRRHRRA